jgi:hypothetical protein
LVAPAEIKVLVHQSAESCLRMMTQISCVAFNF